MKCSAVRCGAVRCGAVRWGARRRRSCRGGEGAVGEEKELSGRKGMAREEESSVLLFTFLSCEPLECALPLLLLSHLHLHSAIHPPISLSPGRLF